MTAKSATPRYAVRVDNEGTPLAGELLSTHPTVESAVRSANRWLTRYIHLYRLGRPNLFIVRIDDGEIVEIV